MHHKLFTRLFSIFFSTVLFTFVVHNSISQEDVFLVAPPWSEINGIDFQEFPKYPQVNAKSYLLLDMHSGKILAQSNSNQIQVMASLVKLMTIYVVLEKIKQGDILLNDTFTIEDDSVLVSMPKDASRMGLKLGDTVSIYLLLRGVLIASANDAARVLAIITYGSIPLFVERMNLVAKTLGLTQTVFDDVSGLSQYNVSSSIDISKLSYYILTNDILDTTVITRTNAITWSGKIKRSTNLLLNSYDGVDGLKTGYTEEAGFNFIATAQRIAFDKKPRRLLAIVLGVTGETIGEGVVKRAEEAKKLLDFGFNQFDRIVLQFNTKSKKVWGGRDRFVDIVAHSKSQLVPIDWIPNIEASLDIENNLWAPLSISNPLGDVYLIYKSNISNKELLISSLPIYPSKDVEKHNIFVRNWHRLYLLVNKFFTQEEKNEH